MNVALYLLANLTFAEVGAGRVVILNGWNEEKEHATQVAIQEAREGLRLGLEFAESWSAENGLRFETHRLTRATLWNTIQLSDLAALVLVGHSSENLGNTQWLNWHGNDVLPLLERGLSNEGSPLRRALVPVLCDSNTSNWRPPSSWSYFGTDGLFQLVHFKEHLQQVFSDPSFTEITSQRFVVSTGSVLDAPSMVIRNSYGDWINFLVSEVSRFFSSGPELQDSLFVEGERVDLESLDTVWINGTAYLPGCEVLRIEFESSNGRLSKKERRRLRSCSSMTGDQLWIRRVPAQ
jgi:hypothetical protein